MVTAIGALGGMFAGGGDSMWVGENGHTASHRPNTAGSSLAFGDRYEGRTVMVAARLMATLIYGVGGREVWALSFRIEAGRRRFASSRPTPPTTLPPSWSACSRP